MSRNMLTLDGKRSSFTAEKYWWTVLFLPLTARLSKPTFTTRRMKSWHNANDGSKTRRACCQEDQWAEPYHITCSPWNRTPLSWNRNWLNWNHPPSTGTRRRIATRRVIDGVTHWRVIGRVTHWKVIDSVTHFVVNNATLTWNISRHWQSDLSLELRHRNRYNAVEDSFVEWLNLAPNTCWIATCLIYHISEQLKNPWTWLVEFSLDLRLNIYPASSYNSVYGWFIEGFELSRCWIA